MPIRGFTKLLRTCYSSLRFIVYNYGRRQNIYQCLRAHQSSPLISHNSFLHLFHVQGSAQHDIILPLKVRLYVIMDVYNVSQ